MCKQCFYNLFVMSTYKNGHDNLTEKTTKNLYMITIFLTVQLWQSKGKFNKNNYMGMNNIMSRYKILFWFNPKTDSRIVKQWISIILKAFKGFIRLLGKEIWHFQLDRCS